MLRQRAFLRSLGKWSQAVIGVAALGGGVDPPTRLRLGWRLVALAAPPLLAVVAAGSIATAAAVAGLTGLAAAAGLTAAVVAAGSTAAAVAPAGSTATAAAVAGLTANFRYFPRQAVVPSEQRSAVDPPPKTSHIFTSDTHP